MIPTVIVVEDDVDMRRTLRWMLEREGLQVRTFASPDEILAAGEFKLHGCMVLDLRLPGMSGLQLQDLLIERGCLLPFLIISGHGDIPAAVAAMRQGAIDFLEKPFSHVRFLESVRAAIEHDAQSRHRRDQLERVKERINSLTPREREVLDLVVAGKLTKQIAKQLGISSKTVEVHRSHITRKMDVDSVAQLVGLVTRFMVAIPNIPPLDQERLSFEPRATSTCGSQPDYL